MVSNAVGKRVGFCFGVLGGQVLTGGAHSGFLVTAAILSVHDGIRWVWYQLRFLLGVCDF